MNKKKNCAGASMPRFSCFFTEPIYIIVCSLVFISILQIKPVTGFQLSILYFVSFLYTFVGFLFTIKCKKSFNIAGFSVIAYYVWSTLTMVVNGDFTAYGLAHIHYLLLFLIALTLIDEKKQQKAFYAIIKTISIVGFIFAFITISGRLIGLFLPQTIDYLPGKMLDMFFTAGMKFPKGSRIPGFAYNANFTGLICEIGIMCSLYLLMEGRRSLKIFSSINVIISLFIVVYLCNSRSAILALFVFCASSLVIHMILFPRKKQILLVLCLIAILIVISVVFILKFDAVRDMIENRIFRVDSIATGSGRTVIFKKSLNEAKNNLFWGEKRSLYSQAIGAAHTHNIILDILLRQGLLSLLLFCTSYVFILGSTLNNLAKTEKREIKEINIFIFSFLIAAIVQGQFEVFLLGDYNLQGIMVALLSGITATNCMRNMNHLE